MGCDAAQIAKSIVFVGDGDPVLAVVSGAHRVDLDKLCDSLDCAEVRQATPDEVRAATGFPVGRRAAVRPRPARGVRRVRCCATSVIWAAGGDGNTLFEITPSGSRSARRPRSAR